MKDAYYFPHDCKSRNDQKIIQVRADYGMLGYGVYFGIIEILREANEYQLPTNYKALAFDLREDEEIIKNVIERYDLFEIYEGKFFSNSLKLRMEKLDKIREKRRQSGRLGGEANAKQMLKQNSSKSKQVEYSKVKESKVKNSIYITENSLSAQTPQAEFIEKFQKSYEAMTGQPFKMEKHHFIMSARLIKTHTRQVVEQKAHILGIMCRDKLTWFTKDGWASFTIETLSRHWNSILPQNTSTDEDKSKQKIAEMLQKENAKNERISKFLESK